MATLRSFKGNPKPREEEPRGSNLYNPNTGQFDMGYSGGRGGRGGDRVMDEQTWLSKNPGKTSEDYLDMLQYFGGRGGDIGGGNYVEDEEGVPRNYEGETPPNYGGVGSSQTYGGGDVKQSGGAIRRDIKNRSRTLLTQNI